MEKRIDRTNTILHYAKRKDKKSYPILNDSKNVRVKYGHTTFVYWVNRKRYRTELLTPHKMFAYGTNKELHLMINQILDIYVKTLRKNAKTHSDRNHTHVMRLINVIMKYYIQAMINEIIFRNETIKLPHIEISLSMVYGGKYDIDLGSRIPYIGNVHPRGKSRYKTFSMSLLRAFIYKQAHLGRKW